jgi:nitrous oxidase accessory protein NosD
MLNESEIQRCINRTDDPVMKDVLRNYFLNGTLAGNCILNNTVYNTSVVIRGHNMLIAGNGFYNTYVEVRGRGHTVVSNLFIRRASYYIFSSVNLLCVPDFVFAHNRMDRVLVYIYRSSGEVYGNTFDMFLGDPYDRMLEENNAVPPDYMMNIVEVEKSEHVKIWNNTFRFLRDSRLLFYAISVLGTSEDVTISGNRFFNFTSYAVYINDTPRHVAVYGNLFVDNNPGGSSQAYDRSGHNFWGYNYWSDYTGVDADGDGYGDIPYPVDGGRGAADRHPLMNDTVQVSDDIQIVFQDPPSGESSDAMWLPNIMIMILVIAILLALWFWKGF